MMNADYIRMNPASNLHILPFGPPAWERRKDIFAGIIADRRSGTLSSGPSPVKWRGGEDMDFRDMLVLVPNERKAKPLLALFLDALEQADGGQRTETGQSRTATAAIPPTIMALNRFVESRIRGVRLIHPLARKLLLEEICRGLKGSRSTGLNLPGLQDEALAGSLSGPISETLDRIYLNNAGSLPDGGNALFPALASVKKEYEKRLHKLGLSDRAAVLAGWEPKPEDFSEYRVIILDGFYDALPHELRLMKAAAEAASGRFHFILEAQGLTLPELSAACMPYAETGRLISELFPGEAGVFCAPREEEDARMLAGTVFTGRPISETARLLKEEPVDRLPGGPKEIKIISALTPEDEAAFIARTIKERALEGRIRLDRTLILLPEPDVYAHALKEIFTDYGIPHSFHEDTPLASSPPAQAFLSLISIPPEGYPFRLMRRAFYLPGGVSGTAADFELCVRGRSRSTGAAAAGRSFWEALAGEKLPFSEELSKILGWLGPLDKGRDYPAGWAELALGLLDNTGMRESLEPLEKILAELREALKNLNLKITAGRFVSMLKDAMGGNRARQTSEFRGVRALGRLEAFSERFETVFIAGMNSGVFPSGQGRDMFFGEAGGTVSWTLEGKTRDSRLFMGLLLGAKEAYLSYPKEKGGRAASPSPWIMALRPYVTAGRAEEITNYSRPSAPEAAMGEMELRRAMAISGQHEGEEEKPRETRFPPQERRRFSVTELEDYLKCGYRYYHRHILRDMPPEEPGEGESPDMAGRVVHDILAKFYAGRKGRPVRESEMETAHRELSMLAERGFARLPDSLASRDAKRKFLEKYAPRVLAGDARLSPGVVIDGVEKKVEAKIAVDGAETAVITGKIDRLELNENGSYTLVDYKTGRYPNGKDIKLAKEFQLPLYAYLLRDCLPDRRPSSFVYYNLGRKGEARDVVCCDSTRYTGKAIKSRSRRREDGGQMDEYVDGIAAKAASAARGIIEGRFPRAESEEECRYCELADSCPGADEKEPDGGEK